MGDLLTLTDVYGEISKACRAAGGQSAFAKLHRIPQSTVNDCCNARGLPNTAMLRAIGLRQRTLYQRIEKKPENPVAEGSGELSNVHG